MLSKINFFLKSKFYYIYIGKHYEMLRSNLYVHGGEVSPLFLLFRGGENMKQS
jgi:hypothetical protein